MKFSLLIAQMQWRKCFHTWICFEDWWVSFKHCLIHTSNALQCSPVINCFYFNVLFKCYNLINAAYRLLNSVSVRNLHIVDCRFQDQEWWNSRKLTFIFSTFFKPLPKTRYNSNIATHCLFVESFSYFLKLNSRYKHINNDKMKFLVNKSALCFQF